MNMFLRTIILMASIGYGLLQAATIKGVVTDSATGGKLDSVRVQLRSGPLIVASDTTDAEGAYSFADVDTGIYTIRASKTNYVTKTVSDTISPDETESIVNIALQAVVTATVAGTVTDSTDGTPLKGAVVQLRRSNRTVGTDTTDEGGNYSFADVESGSYTVLASFTGYVSKTVEAQVAGAALTVNIPLTKTVKATVEGKVADTATGSGLGNAVVQLRSGNQVIATDTSGSDGSFSFAEVESGTYSIRVSLDGYRTKTVNASVSGSSASVTINILLASIAYGTIIGTVTADSAGGAPLAEVTVVLSRGGAAGSPIDTATTDAQGKYMFDKVETAVSYTIRGSKNGYITRSVNLANKKEGVDTVNFSLATLITKTVGVIVRKAADSTALPGASVVVAPSSGSLLIGMTDASGKVAFENLETGTYTFSASAAGFTPRSSRYTLSESSADSVVLYLAAADSATKSLTGTVSDSISGSALAGVIVSIRISTGGGGGGSSVTLAATTADNGTFTIAGIPASARSATLSATLANYRPATRNIAFDTGAVTTTVNIKMLPSTTGIIELQSATHSGGKPHVTLSADGLITLNNILGSGVAEIFNLDGRVLYRHPFTARDASVTLPQRVALAERAFIVRISRPDAGEIHSRVIRLNR